MVKFVSTIKQKMNHILLKTNLPVFHFSILPYSSIAFKRENVPYFH